MSRVEIARLPFHPMYLITQDGQVIVKGKWRAESQLHSDVELKLLIILTLKPA